jgi:hypothetical protein
VKKVDVTYSSEFKAPKGSGMIAQAANESAESEFSITNSANKANIGWHKSRNYDNK